MATSRIEEVKAPLHDGTPRSVRVDVLEVPLLVRVGDDVDYLCRVVAEGGLPLLVVAPHVVELDREFHALVQTRV